MSAHAAVPDPAIDAFATSPSSPFPDGYDLDAERRTLAHLIADGDPDPADPWFARYQLYLEREQALREQHAAHALRHGADPLVEVSQARQIDRIGRLSSDGGDRMHLHTRDAMRLFLGRAVKPGESGYPMAGGQRVAAALRALWVLSGNDNPYADWKLIETDQRLTGLCCAIELERQSVLSMLDAVKAKGLDYTILQSREPATLTLGFASPYGYRVALLLVEFDHLVRVVKSAVLRDLLSSAEGRQRLTAIKHKCRSVFHFVVDGQRYLTQPDLTNLSRADFLPTGDATAASRVERARQRFGDVPKDVLLMRVQPRHSRRRVQPLSDAELRLLDAVPLTGNLPQQTAAKTLVP